MKKIVKNEMTKQEKNSREEFVKELLAAEPEDFIEIKNMVQEYNLDSLDLQFALKKVINKYHKMKTIVTFMGITLFMVMQQVILYMYHTDTTVLEFLKKLYQITIS